MQVFYLLRVDRHLVKVEIEVLQQDEEVKRVKLLRVLFQGVSVQEKALQDVSRRVQGLLRVRVALTEVKHAFLVLVVAQDLDVVLQGMFSLHELQMVQKLYIVEVRKPAEMTLFVEEDVQLLV